VHCINLFSNLFYFLLCHLVQLAYSSNFCEYFQVCAYFFYLENFLKFICFVLSVDCSPIFTRYEPFWQKYQFPQSISETPSSKIIVWTTSQLVPIPIAIAWLIYTYENPTTSENYTESTIYIATSGGCSPSTAGFSRYYFYIPILSLMSVGSLILFISIGKLLYKNVQFLLIQWRMVALALCFLVIVYLIQIYALSIDGVSVVKNALEQFICRSSHPRDPNYYCHRSTIANYEFLMFLNVINCLFPVALCSITIFSLSWFRFWWGAVLKCQKPTLSLDAYSTQPSKSKRLTSLDVKPN
jgi:hypothetical protein